MKAIVSVLGVLAIVGLGLLVYHHQQKPNLAQFIEKVKLEAIAKGVSPVIANHYLDSIKAPESVNNTTVVKQEQHQAQAVLTFAEYKKRLIPDEKIAIAKNKMRQYHAILTEVEKKYGVPASVIVALWGIESDFGDYSGEFPLVKSLAILAYQHHRSDFYRQQLISALIILSRPNTIPQELKSAFDGGMGQTQFEPSIYLYYAVSFNHTGFPNIWSSMPDIFSSIANFLKQNGWKTGQPWGTLIKLPANFNAQSLPQEKWQPLSFWKKKGIVTINGNTLKPIDSSAMLVLPDGTSGPVYLVYNNFHVLLRWNDTTFESLATCLFSDEIK